MRHLATLLLVCALAGAPTAQGFPNRVVVALSGDSIVDGGGVVAPTGIGAALRLRLRELGYDTGGLGYVPAHSDNVSRSADGSVLAPPWTYAGDWLFGGMSPFFGSADVSFSREAPYGPDGHYARTAGGGASASASLEGQRFAAVFVQGPHEGGFRFSVDSAGQVVDARRPGAETAGMAWLTAPPGPPGPHRIAVTADGDLDFTGVIARRSVGGRRQLEVSQLGKSAGSADGDLRPAQRDALAALHADITIVLFGTNEQARLLTTPGPGPEALFVGALRARAAVAHRSGLCAIVPPAPNPRPTAIQRHVADLERDAARLGHCRYAPIFAHIWDRDSASRGLTIDGFHPTAAGYRRMAVALGKLVRQMAPAPGRVATRR